MAPGSNRAAKVHLNVATLTKTRGSANSKKSLAVLIKQGKVKQFVNFVNVAKEYILTSKRIRNKTQRI